MSSQNGKLLNLRYIGIFFRYFLLKFLDFHPIIFPYKTKSDPFSPPSALIFIDGSASGQVALIIDAHKKNSFQLRKPLHGELIALICCKPYIEEPSVGVELQWVCVF